MTFALLLCVLLRQDRRHPSLELPRLIKLHFTKFTFKKKPNLPPFPLLHINTFQSLKFIAEHLPSGKREKKKPAQQFSGKSEKSTNSHWNCNKWWWELVDKMWTRIKSAKTICKLNLHPSVCQFEIVLQPSAIFQKPCFQNGITLRSNPWTLLI